MNIGSLAVWLFATQMLYAQSPAFYHLSTAEGLIDNQVITVARDQNGMLWIGTSEGLNSFDGNRIITYNRHAYPGLPDNRIERIVIDAQNNIYIRTNTHYVSHLDDKRMFHKYQVGDTTDQNMVTGIFYVHELGLVALKGNAHFVLKKRNSGWAFERVRMPFEESLAGAAGFSYYPDNGMALCKRGKKFLVLNYRTKKLMLDMVMPDLDGAHYINHKEVLAYNAEGLFYRIDLESKSVVRKYTKIADQFGLPIKGPLRNITRIDESHFALTTYFSGIYLLDLDQEKVDHWVHDPMDGRSLGGNNTSNIRYDTSGYLFVTTLTSGLHFYNLKQKQANIKPYFADEKRDIFDGYIQDIRIDEGDIVWLAAQDRLIRWNRITDETTYIPLRLADGTNILGKETIRVLQSDDQQRLWVGTTRFGVLVLDKKLRTIQQLTDTRENGKKGLPSKWINALCPDGFGNQWVGTRKGICIVDQKSFKVNSLADHPLLKPLAGLSCISLWQDSLGRMWAGTTQGAWMYDRIHNTLRQYTVNHGLPHNTVHDIQSDLNGNIYLATAEGLAILFKDGKLKRYNSTNGLRNDRCEGILCDKKGQMWVGNLNCLLRYDPENEKFTVFEEGQGFSHGGFRMRSAYKHKTGEMFWGTDKGLIYFLPEKLSGGTVQLTPSIHSLDAMDTTYRFTKHSAIKLPHYNRSLVFSYSGGELTGNKKIQFLYRLSGFDTDWKSPPVTGQATFGKLPPGRYQFTIRASHDGKLWYDAPYFIDIEVSAPWWQQWWFRSFLAMMGGLLVFGIYRYQRKKKAREIIRSTLEYFANSTYDHSSPEDIYWDIAYNCVSRLGFEDCVIYQLDVSRNTLVQIAAYGSKSPKVHEIVNPIEIPVGQGIVGAVAQSSKAEVIGDTSLDPRYIEDDVRRYSELAVPIVHEGKILGVIDSEHHQKHFFTKDHLNVIQSIAVLCSAKVSRAMAIEAMRKGQLEVMALNIKMAESKFLNLRLQMNPHFLFNSLSSIQHLIVSQQTTKAYRYLTVFSNFLRSLLNFADKNFIVLDEEVKILKMYIELEALRFDESFHYEVLMDENLDNESVLVPSLMVQPFVENAIWHGLLHKAGEKKLSIRFSVHEDDFLTCVVEDNGIGREAAMAIRDQMMSSRVHESKGIAIIRERLNLLQQKTGKPASVNFEDLVPEGTRVTIHIPYYNPEEV